MSNLTWNLSWMWVKISQFFKDNEENPKINKFNSKTSTSWV